MQRAHHQQARSDHSRPRTLANGLLLATTVALALLVYGALRFPASVADGGSVSAFVACAALLSYAAASRWGRRSSSDAARIALGAGAQAGVLLGAAAATNHYLEIFATLPPPLPTVLGAGMWGLMFLLYGGVSAATYHRVASLGLGVLASVWASLFSTVMTVAFAVSISFLFLPHMRTLLAGAFATSGMADPNAFVVRHLFDAASEHLLIAPVVALVSGTASGLASWILQRVPRGTAVALAVLALLLVAAGAGALGFASSLERHARPPFIMFGLSSLFVTLTAAYPLLLAIRHPNVDPTEGELAAPIPTSKRHSGCL
jgi:hypothetical protein